MLVVEGGGFDWIGMDGLEALAPCFAGFFAIVYSHRSLESGPRVALSSGQGVNLLFPRLTELEAWIARRRV